MTLKDAVRRGLPFRPERGRRRIVRGDDLRALLMSCCTRTGVTSAGIEIDGGSDRLITIVAGNDGIIDLGGLKASCGSPLPSLVFANCVIEGSLRVAGSHFAALRIASSKVDSIDATRCRVAGDLSIIGLSRVPAGITLRNASVAGSLEVADVEFAYPSVERCGASDPTNPTACNAVVLDLNGVEADAIRLRSLRLGGVKPELPGTSSAAALFDLQGATCRIFDDDDAFAWVGLGDRQRWSLLLRGITLEALDHSGGERPRMTAHSTSGLGDNATLRSLRRRTMLTAFDQNVGGPRPYSKLVQTPSYSAQPHVVFAQAYSRAEERWIATEIATDQIKLRWASAALVIRRRVREKASLSVGICAFLSAILVGIYHYSEVAAAIKLGDLTSLQWQLVLSWISAAMLAIGGLWVSHLLVSLIGYLFGAFFAFGLRPQRAVVAMGIYLMVGIGGVYAAVEEGALYPSTTIGGVQHVAEGDQPRWAGQAILAVHQISAEGCNQVNSSGIDRTIYALDVFIPVLDLRQECAFTFRQGDQAGWRLAKSIYELLGWIVVSLTLLSLSGVLRRDIEG